MFHKKTIRDVELADQVILLRADYNVPLATIHAAADELAENNELTNAGEVTLAAPTSVEITSDFRIRASLPTLQYLLAHDVAKIVIISHLGRPKGKEDSLSLRPVAEHLAELLPGHVINFVDEITGPEVAAAVEDLPEGGILLLENLRFDPREKANDADFARELVDFTGAQLFVQDGFAVTHREQASTAAITKLLPSVAGLLVEKEVTMLTRAVQDPARPFTVVIGGAKVTDKQPLIDKFLPIADHLAVGGKIAADGYTSNNPKIYVATDFDEDGAGEKLDIGPVATTEVIDLVQQSQTVLWNGVLGKVEDAAYATSSTILAKYLGENPAITSIICGGDTAGFVEGLCTENPDLQFSLISTGGGAALELLSGGTMPGLENLTDKD